MGERRGWWWWRGDYRDLLVTTDQCCPPSSATEALITVSHAAGRVPTVGRKCVSDLERTREQMYRLVCSTTREHTHKRTHTRTPTHAHTHTHTHTHVITDYPVVVGCEPVVVSSDVVCPGVETTPDITDACVELRTAQ